MKSPLISDAEAISVALTPIVIASCLVVVVLYIPAAIRATMMNGLRGINATQCLIVGIAIGWLGKICDNAYWAIPWMHELVDHPRLNFWFHMGAIANIFFRQGTTVISACFHIAAAAKFAEKNIQCNIIQAYLVGLLGASLYLVWIWLVVMNIN